MNERDYHVHTNFCDGKDTPEAMVRAAIERGMAEIGLLTHSFTAFDPAYCIAKDKIIPFQAEINRLKEKYANEIHILCGVEQDIYSEESTAGFDYAIGSVHYVKCGEAYYPIDESAEQWKRIVHMHFDDDPYALAETYYRTVAQVAAVTKPNIIGHFDLVSKFNEGERLFSESDDRYIQSYRAALDCLLPYRIPFEVNTGAIARGYRHRPYPNPDMIQYIKAHGGSLILSSDSHEKGTLCFAFDRWQAEC